MIVEPIVEKKENTPLLIAGPCSAETHQQLFSTAQELVATKKIDLFRCGVWKPRTSPNSFEGVGQEALPWLEEIEQTLNLKTCIEIASPNHLEKALKANISHFWIGARTSANPFAINEIANAAKGLDIAVMIKNPTAIDIDLWYGNFERFANVGIKRLAAIYRGFAGNSAQPYRNNPAWEQLIEFKRRHRHLPIICDPSHLSGDKNLLFEVAQKALYLDIDGLMIECHHNPASALCDKKQQITPKEYQELIGKLTIPTDKEPLKAQLNLLRSGIDEIDNQLIGLLVKRFEIAQQIAILKKENSIPILQIERWQSILNSVEYQAKQCGLDPKMITTIFNAIHQGSVSSQEKTILDE